jgi:hypothetical protein
MELKLNSKNAQAAYDKVDKAGKELLKSLYPNFNFDQDITARIKTLDDAIDCVKMCDELNAVLAYKGSNEQMKGVAAFARLSIVREALNQGWKADFSKDEPKYYPYQIHKPGVGLSSAGWAFTAASACVGARLSLKTSDLAIYAGKQFEPEYREFNTL